MLSLKPNNYFANNYLLLEQLGIGGFSEVWKVQDIKAGIINALKVYIGVDNEGIETFRDEYTRMYNINDANILKATHFDVYEGRPYLVMPYCNNGSAMKELGKASEYTLALIMAHIGAALAYCHSQTPPLIHRDIKPDNFLRNNDQFLLSDFGISSDFQRTLQRSLQADRVTIDIRQTPKGATPPAYRGPEMYDRDRMNMGPILANDTWAFGASLYELATGNHPFGDMGGLMQRNGMEYSDLPPYFSRELNYIIKQCMALETWDRPSTAQLKEWGEFYLKFQTWPINIEEKIDGGLLVSQPPPPPPSPTVNWKSIGRITAGAALGLLVIFTAIFLPKQARTQKAEDHFAEGMNHFEKRRFQISNGASCSEG